MSIRLTTRWLYFSQPRRYPLGNEQRDELMKWFEENSIPYCEVSSIGGLVERIKYVFEFDNVDDALRFKLYWC